MSRPIHLLKVVSACDFAGLKSSEFAYIRALKDRGLHVSGIIVGNGPAAEAYIDHLDNHLIVRDAVPSYGRSRTRRIINLIRNEYSSRRAARKAFGEFQSSAKSVAVDVIGVRRSNYLLLAGLLGRSFNCPGVWHLPNTIDDPVGRLYYRHLIRRYKILPVGNSYHTLETLGIRNGHVVYPGYTPERLVAKSRVDLRETLDIPSDATIFAIVSRLVKSKAPDLVLRAFLESEAFQSGAHLVVAGGPLDCDFGVMLKNIAAEHGKGRVHFVGYLDDVSIVYNSVDIVVNGRRDAEPFGITIVEALAAGLPVIAFAKGGPRETIADGATGWLVESPSVAGFKEAMDRAWQSRKNWSVMGRRARRDAEKFTVDRQLDKYIEILEALLA